MKLQRLRCGVCGRFVSYEADYYIPYGGYLDEEQPDPVFMCDKCIQDDIERIKNGGTMFSHWSPAGYQWNLAEELGYQRVDGWWVKDIP